MMALTAASLEGPMVSPLIQPVASSLINAISRKGPRFGFLPLLALPLMMKVLQKLLQEQGKQSKLLEEDIITWINWIKIFI